MIEKEPRKRLAIDLTEEQWRKLRKHLPWGLGRRIFSNIVDALIAAFEADADTTISGFISGKLEIVVRREEKSGNSTRHTK